MSSVAGVGSSGRQSCLEVEEPDAAGVGTGGQSAGTSKTAEPQSAFRNTADPGADLMSRDPSIPAQAPLAAGTSALLQKHQARDLSGLLETARYQERNASSLDQGTHDIDEYNPAYDRHSYRSVPNTATSSCNDGKSYCDPSGDVVMHTVAQERLLSEEFGRQYDTRNFDVPEPPPELAADAAKGTLSVGASLGACAADQCVGLTVEGTLGINGSSDVSLSGYYTVAAETAASVGVDASVNVKLTNAADAGDVASGSGITVGGQVGVVGADYVQGDGYQGGQVTFGLPSIGLRGSVSHTLLTTAGD